MKNKLIKGGPRLTRREYNSFATKEANAECSQKSAYLSKQRVAEIVPNPINKLTNN